MTAKILLMGLSKDSIQSLVCKGHHSPCRYCHMWTFLQQFSKVSEIIRSLRHLYLYRKMVFSELYRTSRFWTISATYNVNEQNERFYSPKRFHTQLQERRLQVKDTTMGYIAMNVRKIFRFLVINLCYAKDTGRSTVKPQI